MEGLTNYLIFCITILIIIVIICYVALAVFLNNFSKKVYGEPSVMAWIPFANIYLLGKLTFNREVGYGLVALFVLSGTLTLTYSSFTVILRLPHLLQTILGAIFAGALVSTIIFGLRKYDQLEENSSSNNSRKKPKKKTNKEIEKIAKENDEFFNN